MLKSERKAGGNLLAREMRAHPTRGQEACADRSIQDPSCCPSLGFRVPGSQGGALLWYPCCQFPLSQDPLNPDIETLFMSEDIFESFASEIRWDLPEQSAF